MTDVKHMLTVIGRKPVKKTASMAEWLEALSSIRVNALTDDAEKDLFYEVAVAVKESKKRVKEVQKGIDEKHKPTIKELEDELDKAKQEYRALVDPLKQVIRELDRIDAEARDAVSAYTTAQVKAAQEAAKKIVAEAPASEPVFLPKEVAAVNGHQPNMVQRTTVMVLDLQAVPDEYCTWAPDVEAVGRALAGIGITNPEIKVQADGTVVIKADPAKLPSGLRRKNGVKPAVIIGVGGCPGVELATEYRPVVR